ncbi:MAG: hypothetical protein CVT68_08840 [Actinobacteria bacterium HGW-Actinobacteria-8]|nr:MAG: hypothetical protein CVT68_08840 [Actinobacteria bacterium HGW-Actinobacteria-8]
MSQQLRRVATARISASALILFALGLTLTDTSGLVPDRAIDLLGYYTLQANVIALAVWVASVIASTRTTSAKTQRALEYARAFAVANLVLVAILYWAMIAPLGLVSGTRLATVMVISHIVTPIYASIDFLVVGPAEPLPMRGWWWFFAIPTAWLSVAIPRAYAGGWVPYDYLDPTRGWRAIVGTVSLQGLLLAALAVAALRIRWWRSVAHFQLAEADSDDSISLDLDRAVA